MTATSSGSLELTVLIAVSRLAGEAYGLAIRRDVSARTGHDYSIGAVYTTLQRLEEKGLVSSRLTAPLPIRGGRARREFKLSAAGQRAIRQAQRMAVSIWNGVGTTLIPKPS